MSCRTGRKGRGKVDTITITYTEDAQVVLQGSFNKNSEDDDDDDRTTGRRREVCMDDVGMGAPRGGDVRSNDEASIGGFNSTFSLFAFRFFFFFFFIGRKHKRLLFEVVIPSPTRPLSS